MIVPLWYDHFEFDVYFHAYPVSRMLELVPSTVSPVNGYLSTTSGTENTFIDVSGVTVSGDVFMTSTTNFIDEYYKPRYGKVYKRYINIYIY